MNDTTTTATEQNQPSREPQVGDIVRFMTRAHPTMGEPYEVIGRVERHAVGLIAGDRGLWTAQGPVTIVNGPVERAAPKLLEALEHCHALIRTDGVRPGIGEGIDLHKRAEAAAKAAIAEAKGLAA